MDIPKLCSIVQESASFCVYRQCKHSAIPCFFPVISYWRLCPQFWVDSVCTLVWSFFVPDFFGMIFAYSLPQCVWTLNLNKVVGFWISVRWNLKNKTITALDIKTTEFSVSSRDEFSFYKQPRIFTQHGGNKLPMYLYNLQTGILSIQKLSYLAQTTGEFVCRTNFSPSYLARLTQYVCHKKGAIWQ